MQFNSAYPSQGEHTNETPLDPSAPPSDCPSVDSPPPSSAPVDPGDESAKRTANVSQDDIPSLSARSKVDKQRDTRKILRWLGRMLANDGNGTLGVQAYPGLTLVTHPPHNVSDETQRNGRPSKPSKRASSLRRDTEPHDTHSRSCCRRIIIYVNAGDLNALESLDDSDSDDCTEVDGGGDNVTDDLSKLPV